MRPIVPVLLLSLIAACAPRVQVVPVRAVSVRPDTTRTSRPPAPEPPVSPEVPERPFAGITPGRFDGGKMWTFDNPPLEYFREAYDFSPDSAWFSKARSSALRLGTFCSASFVSEDGLVMTNHHCARESVSEVAKEGEELLDDGFLASTREEERKVEDLYVDQLVSIADVTSEIYEASERARTASTQQQARERRVEVVEARLGREAEAKDSTLVVEVIPLYHGGQYAAYTFRRYKDVRLVMAPELQIGFFGGDWDNFTYPRYNLDFSFFRVYGPDGTPLKPVHHFSWSRSGVETGEPVFVVGNPGSTSRLSTVAQLEYERDHALPVALAALDERSGLLNAYIKEHPEEAGEFDLRNAYFSLQNSRKSLAGQLAGLESDWLIPRRGAAESTLLDELVSSDSLNGLYGSVFREIDAVQRSKAASIGSASAFAFFLNPSMSSRVLSRGMYGYVYTLLKQRGAPPDQLKTIREEALEIESWPAGLEETFIALRLRELERTLGKSDASVRRLLGERTAEEVARDVAKGTALTDSSGFRKLMDGSYLGSEDPSVALIEVIGPLYFTLNQQLESFETREDELNARLARARFAVHGDAEPPDASFSLRISDGVVSGYEYNGTRAPAFTTFYGMYDRYFAAGARAEWALPERWAEPSSTFDYDTRVNLVSTNDITGGNSGSPLLNRDLEIVGLVFDSNIEALPNEYLFTDTSARSISVDARGIIEALKDIYFAEHLVAELLGQD